MTAWKIYNIKFVTNTKSALLMTVTTNLCTLSLTVSTVALPEQVADILGKLLLPSLAHDISLPEGDESSKIPGSHRSADEIKVYKGVTPYWLVNSNPCPEQAHCLHLQNLAVREKWSCQELCTNPQGVVAQKISVFGIRYFLMDKSAASSLVFPPYRGEGIWVRQGPWELYQR